MKIFASNKKPECLWKLIILGLFSFALICASPSMAFSDSHTDNSSSSPTGENENLSVAGIGTYIAYTALGLFGLFVLYIVLTIVAKPLQSKGSPDEIIESTGCGSGGRKKKKVLIAYYTKHGATSSVGKKIHELLCEAGYDADLRSITNIKDDDLSVYDAYVLGSAVYWARITPEIVQFVTKYKDLFLAKPTVLFACCMTLIRENEKNQNRVYSYIDASMKGAYDFDKSQIGMFAGKIDYEKITPGEWVIMKFIMKAAGLPEGDHRDWDKVKKWTTHVVDTFLQ